MPISRKLVKSEEKNIDQCVQNVIYVKIPKVIT